MPLPIDLRQALANARRQRGWSQGELGRRVGLPQMHISKIENGKVTPRFDTLLEIARVLDRDLVLVPREKLPVVRALLADTPETTEEQPLYAPDEDADEVS
jgi:transcriptional regulator with XRE-family HTH domain